MKLPKYLSSITFTFGYISFYYWLYNNGYLYSIPASDMMAITTMIMMSSKSPLIIKSVRRLMFIKNTIELLS